jgi:glycolate oxidase iron-sulfur subunit
MAIEPMPIDPALIDDCVHCGFCLPTCPTYGPLWQQEMDSPRGRIWLMKGLVEGTVELSDTVVEHFDRCLGCMACVTSCPSGVQYDRLIEQTRELIEERYERTPDDWLLRTLVFAVFPHPRRLRAALALAPLGRRLPLPRPLRPLVDLAPPWRSTAQPPELTPAAGERRARVGLLLGCVQRVLFGDVNAATARVLAAEGCEVVAPRDQACCGALHLHAGRRAEGHARAERIAELFKDAGVERLVVNAAGCGSHLKDAGLDLPVVDVSELLAELGPRAERHPLELRVAFQDSCHLLHAQRVQAQPRDLLRSIPGLELAEPAEQAICCGSAGIYNLAQPDAAAELGARKAEHVAATGADVYASANPGCLVQVSSALRRAGHGLPALHPVELVDASIRGVAAVRVVREARR